MKEPAAAVKKPSWLSKARQLVNRHRITTLIVLGSILITLNIGIISWFDANNRPAIIDYSPIIVKKPEPKYYSPLTGRQLSSESATKKAVTAVIIENSPDARPQSGLKESGIIYEAIAEGGITRFLVLYQEDKPKLVGPVRSLRPYYVDWLTPYNPSVAHVGGSSQALKLIRNGSYRDIDQFFNASTYWRTTDRYAPHNVYTDFKRIDALNKSKGYTESSFTGFKRTDPKPKSKPNAKSINVTMSGPSFNSSYKYDPKKNNYTRYQGGQVHKDREKGVIKPNVIIVMKSNMHTYMDDGPRQNYQTTGSGEAYVFQNGTVVKGTWQKKNRQGNLVFKNKDNKTIPLVRGQTWISIVPANSGGVSWQ